MKKIIRKISFNKTILKSTATFLNYKIQGDVGSVFSLQIKDSSSPNKFYNFVTNVFTNTFTSENTLSNIVLESNTYQSSINIPESLSGNNYRFLLFVEPIFNTEVTGENSFFLKKDIEQKGQVTVRFSTASDQAASNFVGLGTNVGSVTAPAGISTSTTINISNYTISDDGDGTALGYKFETNENTLSAKVADSLQPIDSDFFTSQSKTTSGSGSSATAMILTNIDNLVVGMSLISITSSTVTTSGSLGVLTFPTITAIDTDTKTVTLSSAHSWADNKAVVFRAYGFDLIRQSTGGVFSFSNFEVKPGEGATCKVNGATSASDEITVTNINGVSIGSIVIGAGIDTKDNNNHITGLSSNGLIITVTGAQTLSDKTILKIIGSSTDALINGQILISTFPSISTDIFYDIDRAVVLATHT
tara:strand:+ start:254 stop:1507 length:1254 start_codon:yes stop_codon:yes gene_type:complete